MIVTPSSASSGGVVTRRPTKGTVGGRGTDSAKAKGTEAQLMRRGAAWGVIVRIVTISSSGAALNEGRGAVRT